MEPEGSLPPGYKHAMSPYPAQIMLSFHLICSLPCASLAITPKIALTKLCVTNYYIKAILTFFQFHGINFCLLKLDIRNAC